MEVWCVASKSHVKLEAVRCALPGCEVVGVKAPSHVPEQPVNEPVGRLGANNRLGEAARRWTDPEPPAGWIAIESFIEGLGAKDKPLRDRAVVLVVLADGRKGEAFSESTEFPASLYAEAWAATPLEERDEFGCSVTVGDIIHKTYPDIPSDDWQSNARFGGVTRIAKLHDAVIAAVAAARSAPPSARS
jgi:non-canonical (house-cleaning) NTP pyrophosphatase